MARPIKPTMSGCQFNILVEPVRNTCNMSEATGIVPRPKLSPGTAIGECRVETRLGLGPHAEVYLASMRGRKEKVALKVENPVTTLRHESAVLKAFSKVSSPYSCGYYGLKLDASYGGALAMELLGEDLSVFRKRNARMDFQHVADFAVQMLRAIQAFHNTGFVHRDIKPSNFVRRRRETRKHRFDIALVDFGISRRFMNDDGTLRPARESASFRGTAKYASLNAHRSLELGRRDDLWSLFYIIVDFVMGSLPWTADKESADTGKQFFEANYVSLLPQPLQDLHSAISVLKFEDTPRYTQLEAPLVSLGKLPGKSKKKSAWPTAEELMNLEKKENAPKVDIVVEVKPVETVPQSAEIVVEAEEAPEIVIDDKVEVTEKEEATKSVFSAPGDEMSLSDLVRNKRKSSLSAQEAPGSVKRGRKQSIGDKESMVGSRIRVYWPDDDDWYVGTVIKALKNGKHKVRYDDGDSENVILADEQYEVVEN